MTHRLSLKQGSALLLGAVLGPGVLALPHLAASAAGPASIIAWAALLALSIPVATTFATLGARHPDGGGVATFTAQAFGARASAVVGWWFYFAIPVGVPAAAMIGGGYVASALHADQAPMTCAILAAAIIVNYAGLRMSGGLQLALAALLVALLVMAVVLAAPAAHSSSFTPFATHGWTGVLRAAGVLFFAFAGWEAVSHLSAEFADPQRDLPRATALTLAVVTVLYLGLAITVIAVLGTRASTSAVPLALLLERGIGSLAGPVTAVAALALSLGAMNAYIAGGSRLGTALARDGALPPALAGGGEARRSLTLLAILCLTVTLVTLRCHIPLDVLMRATSACLAAVTAAGMAAATRLLPPGAPRRTAAFALAFTLVALVSCGLYLLVPAGLGAAALMAGPRVAKRTSRVPECRSQSVGGAS